MVGGAFYFSGSPRKCSICRVLTTGALDSGFNGVVNGAHVSGNINQPLDIYKIVVQPDGKILIAGGFTAYNNVPFGGLARLTSTGAIDGSFTPPATISSAGACNALLLQPDGKIMVGGSFTSLGSAANGLARFSSTGAFDSSFAVAGGFASGVSDLALLPNGRVVLGGNYGSFQGSTDSGPVWQFVAGLPGLPGTLQLASATYSGTGEQHRRVVSHPHGRQPGRADGGVCDRQWQRDRRR